MADREHLVLDAHKTSIETAAVQRQSVLQFLALLVHALEDGVPFQHLPFADDISDEVVVTAVEFPFKTWLEDTNDR